MQARTNGRLRMFVVLGCCVVWLVSLAPNRSLAAGKGEPGRVFPARIELSDETADLGLLAELGIDVDAVFNDWARVWLIDEERRKLQHLGLQVTELPDEAKLGARGSAEGSLLDYEGIPPVYHTYETLTAELQGLAAQFPDLARLISIGRSVQDRELWMMKITANPDVDEDEPEVSYIAAMHGDEVVGKELTLNLIHYLLENHGSDARVADLLDTTEIWIMPSMNPDGTALAQRYNAHGVNLNRDFPDRFTDPVNTPDNREPETAAVMNWAADRTTVLSANMHGGVLVANYPFDSNPQGASVYTPSPDDAVFVSVSRSYADNNPAMFASNGHASFDNGICNGADWYTVNGGMQDWSYVWRGDAHVTLEVSEPKWPSASQLPSYWDDNLESMLAYLERASEGVRGIVTAADTGRPVLAAVTVVGNEFVGYTDPAVGDYHRILLPGSYTLEFDAEGYSTAVREVSVTPGTAVRYNVELQPLAVSLQPERGQAHGDAPGDRWLDPGESADLQVFLRSLGVTATSISADLEPVGWYAGIERAGAEYPDLPPGETASSLAPHHRISVASDVPAGHKVGFALRWRTDQGSGHSGPFFVPVGAAPCTTFESAEVPRSIPDHQAIISDVVVLDATEVYNARVTVDIDHPYVGDLWLVLRSPSGTPVTLHNRSGGSTDSIVGTYGRDLVPAEPLARFLGEPAQGTWTLEVRDGAGGDTGILQSWSLEVCGRPLETATPEMRLRSVSTTVGETLLEWWPYPGMHSYRVYRSNDASSAAAFTNVTSEDDDVADTRFVDGSTEPLVFFLVTAVGPNGEGPRGHHGE